MKKYNVLFAFNYVTIVVPVETGFTDDDDIIDEALFVLKMDEVSCGNYQSVEVEEQ